MKDKDMSSFEHRSWRCQYHIVFASKYRRIDDKNSLTIWHGDLYIVFSITDGVGFNTLYPHVLSAFCELQKIPQQLILHK